MGGERQGPKSGRYVGGFLQLFDWNAKSRKKLFSSKSDLPDHPRQRKKSEGNFPKTRIRMLDEDEIGATASIKGSSVYSCASSVTDEEGYVSKPPGVVARLMGLDTLPTSNAIEPYSSQFFDTQSLKHYIYEEHQTSVDRRLEKFQTEILPPKSAKSVPITQHKLLSPIKKPGFVQYNDVAHIMEAAARIIDPGPQVTSARTRISLSGSSPVPIKVRELKEKMVASQRLTEFSEVSKRLPLESSTAKNLKGQPLNKSWNESCSTGDSSAGRKNRGKSINLAIQAKVNVQRREGLNPRLNHMEGMKEDNKVVAHKKPSARTASTVLRQNNQKQNCSSAKENVPPTKSKATNVHGRKVVSGDSSHRRQRNFYKDAGSSSSGSKKSSLEGRNIQKNVSQSGARNVPRKKRIIDDSVDSMLMSRNEKSCQSNSVEERQFSWAEEGIDTGADVVSFTFSNPTTPPMSGMELAEEINNISSNNRTAEFTACQENVKVLPSPGYDVVGDSLSVLLEQKLRELTDETETSDSTLSKEEASSAWQDSRRLYDQGEETDECSSSRSRRLQSPVSILLDSCDLIESSNSTNSAKSSMAEECKQQKMVNLSCLEKTHQLYTEMDLSDSASSAKGDSYFEGLLPKLPADWELDYIKDILSNVELMFKDCASGRTRDIINPHLFDQMERKRGCSSSYKDAALVEKKVLFDCVREYLDWRCQRFIGGGCSAWKKGFTLVRNKARLVEEVNNQIQEWRSMRNCMVDELIDKDLSIVYGKWLDFELDGFGIAVDLETQIFESLVAEVAADIPAVRQRSSSCYTSFLSTV